MNLNSSPYDIGAVTDYIRAAAKRRGINPDTAVNVARTEGLARNTWQSNESRGGVREPSYGPFQMLKGGPGTGYPSGLGNAMQQNTGLDPADPANVEHSIDYALDTASKDGWRQWYGAAKAGIGRFDGIGTPPADPTLPGAYPALPQMASAVPMNISPQASRGLTLDVTPGGFNGGAAAPAAAGPVAGKFDLANMFEANGGGMAKGAAGGLSNLISGLSGGGDDQAMAQFNAEMNDHGNIMPNSGAHEAEQAGRMQAGSQLMASLLRKKPPPNKRGMAFSGMGIG